MSKEILENLNILLEAVKAFPESHFSLERYREDNECGSNFCTLGIATTIPHFVEKGYVLRPLMHNEKKFFLQINEQDFDAAGNKILENDFGKNAFDCLFDLALYGLNDSENDQVKAWKAEHRPEDMAADEDEEEEYPHQKDLAIWRLERQIARYMAQRRVQLRLAVV